MRHTVGVLGGIAVLSMLGLVLRMSCAGAADVPGDGVQPASGSAWTRGLPTDPSYFPIAVWLQGPQNAKRYQDAGINLYIALWQGPTEKQLADLKAAGMQVICDQNEVGLAHLEDPTIVGWMHGDEPDNAQPVKDAQGRNAWGPCIPPQKIVDDYERLRKTDPSRPVLLNLGQGVANDEWRGRGSGAKLSDYETYVKGGDIISFDVYPVASNVGGEGVERLWLVPKGVDRLMQWTEGLNKRIWNCVECTRIDGGNQASPEQVKAQVWMALTHGSTGLIYFVHQFKPTFCEWALLEDPVMLPAVTAINRQIHRLAPVLNTPTIPGAVEVTSSDPEVPISVMAKFRVATYIFAVGMRNKATKATFRVKDARAGAKVEVIDENRTLPLEDGVFVDDFAPYGVHAYRIE
jgi:hypothetical protein